jgi:predicted porin
MKKSLIAIAALAAVSAASAQSSVTMYGNIDVGFGSHSTTSRDGVAFTKSSGVMDGSWAGSRLGFRGTEDLGGGLKAEFTLEQGINPTSNNGFNQRVASGAHQLADATGGAYAASNNRQSFLGLAGGFGSVRVGYQYTNSYDLVAFSGYSISEFQGGNYQNQTHANGTRANAITYVAPAMSGVTLKAQFGQGASRMTAESDVASSIGAGTLTKNNNQYTSLMAAYAQGPLSAAYAYSKASLSTSAAATLQTSPVSQNLGVSYDLGVAKLSATLGTLRNGASATVGESRTNARQISVSAPVGAVTLLMSTGSAKTTQAGVAAATMDSKGTTFGASYALSKRTNVYGYSGSEKNDAKLGSSAGYKDSKTMVGVRHQF